MYGDSNSTAYSRVVSSLCVCVLCVILVAGLWPFHASRNQVEWLGNDKGLDFGRYGSVVSIGKFSRNRLNGDSAASIEIWLEPRFLGGKHTILSFDGSDHPGAPFSLHQYYDLLVVHQHNIDSRGTVRTAWLRADNVFQKKQPVFVTITLGKHNTSVYLNGSMAQSFPILGTSTNNVTGRLVLANSSSTDDSFSGRILGLALYDRQLTPAQIVQHYESWTKNQRPELAQDEAPVALYLFNEQGGVVVHNLLDPATDLVIPKRYFVLHSAFLSPPWREYHANWSYWKNFGINIAGFIPLGFCMVAYFTSIRTMNKAAAITIVLGFATSLTIETMQAFLPTRDSGMTDLITNTLGTALGVILYRLSVTQRLLTKVEQYSISTNLAADTITDMETVFSESVKVGASTPI